MGAAVVSGADAGVTKDPHQRLGAGASALAVRQHDHAWLVPAIEARQTALLHLARRCGWRVAKWSRFPSRRLPEVLKAANLGIADGV
jgi:hypothetical protein